MLTPINIPLGSSKLALRLEELDIDLDDLDLEKGFPIQVVRLLNTPVDRLQDDETLKFIHIKPTVVGQPCKVHASMHASKVCNNKPQDRFKCVIIIFPIIALSARLGMVCHDYPCPPPPTPPFLLV